MTQEHLQEVSEIRRNIFFESPEDEELWTESFTTAMQLWEDFAEGYRTAIIEYKFLAAERRKAKICPIYAIPKGIINEYPVIRFFFCLDEISAREYLRDIRAEELPARTMRLLETIETNHAYNSIVTRVKEFRYRQKHGYGKTCYCYGLSTRLPSRK